MKLQTLLLTAAIAMSATSAWATQSGPVVRLFPTTVLEDIRETSQVAEEMEDNQDDFVSSAT